MKTSTAFRSLITVAPYIHPNLLVKREGNTCGDLQGAYSNVQAPICSGANSICTFAGNLQGCCDNQNVCQFYTTCVGLYAPETCVGSFCLPCPLEAPYCIKYNFWDNQSQRGYDGYSCAEFQATQTIWGIATSIVEASTTSFSSSAAASSSTSSVSSSETPVLTRFNTTEPASSTFNNSSIIPSSTTTSSEDPSTVSNSSTSAPTDSLTPEPKSVSHTGAIAGGIVGGLVLLAIIVVALCCLKRRRSRRGVRTDLPYVGPRVGEVQQVYDDDDDVPRPTAWRGQRHGA